MSCQHSLQRVEYHVPLLQVDKILPFRSDKINDVDQSTLQKGGFNPNSTREAWLMASMPIQTRDPCQSHTRLEVGPWRASCQVRLQILALLTMLLPPLNPLTPRPPLLLVESPCSE